MTKARENSDYTGLAADIVAGDTAARAGRKNLILNGGFDVWQRGTSFSPAGSGIYTADRWKFEGAGLTISRSTEIPSGHLFKYSARIQNTAASTSNNRTLIEDLDTILPNGVPWVLSAWIKVTSGGISIDCGDTAISGGFNSPSVWTKVSVTSSTRNASATNGWIDIFLDANTDAYITGVQLELGSVATDFEHRSYGEELALCQRYYYTTIYQKRQTSIANGSYWHESLMFPTQMRTAPTCVWTTSAGNWFTVNGLYEYADGNGVRIDFRTASVSGSAYLYGSITADAEL